MTVKVSGRHGATHRRRICELLGAAGSLSHQFYSHYAHHAPVLSKISDQPPRRAMHCMHCMRLVVWFGLYQKMYCGDRQRSRETKIRASSPAEPFNVLSHEALYHRRAYMTTS